MEYLYETIGLVIFLIISLIFINPPAWVMRALKSLVVRLDRWM